MYLKRNIEVTFLLAVCSPDGLLLACLGNLTGKNYIIIALIDHLRNLILLDVLDMKRVFYKKLERERLAKSIRTSHRLAPCMIKFSKDSCLLSVSHPCGGLATVNIKPHPQKFAQLVPGWNITSYSPDEYLSDACAVDFDPRFKHTRLCYATNHGHLVMCDTARRTTIGKLKVAANNVKVLSVKFHPYGHVVAVSTSGSRIHLIDSDAFTSLYSVVNNIINVTPSSMNNEEANRYDNANDEVCLPSDYYSSLDPTSLSQHGMRQVNGEYPVIQHIAFSNSGDHLLSTSSDGFLRIWQLSPDLSLKHLCRMSIISNVKLCDLRYLPLPKQIISFLMNEPLCR